MFTYDFHIHSALSPCGDLDMTPNNIVNMAAMMGISTIALSDHNSIGNVRATMDAGKCVGIKVIPAMEVETVEEVHILTLFPDFDSAEAVYCEVYKNLPNIKNKPEIFGHQYYMDREDNIIGEEERLLVNPTSLSINKLFDMVKSVHGIFIPAHIDRHSYSVLTNLGFIPDDLDIKYVEISKKVDDIDAYLSSRPDILGYKIFRSSDAHYLEDMAAEPHALECNIEELFDRELKL